MGWVRGAVPFLNRLRQQGTLVDYFNRCRLLFDQGAKQRLSQLSDKTIA
ncbi:hypothetical protein G7009_21165 [Pseudomonas capeferrum]|nr:hypothetical protein [Pseudomonas capeferrum]MBA1204231.1 hypothetical protein [Pseudomonas capeferrum]